MKYNSLNIFKEHRKKKKISKTFLNYLKIGENPRQILNFSSFKDNGDFF